MERARRNWKELRGNWRGLLRQNWKGLCLGLFLTYVCVSLPLRFVFMHAWQHRYLHALIDKHPSVLLPVIKSQAEPWRGPRLEIRIKGVSVEVPADVRVLCDECISFLPDEPDVDHVNSASEESRWILISASDAPEYLTDAITVWLNHSGSDSRSGVSDDANRFLREVFEQTPAFASWVSSRRALRRLNAGLLVRALLNPHPRRLRSIRMVEAGEAVGVVFEGCALHHPVEEPCLQPSLTVIAARGGVFLPNFRLGYSAGTGFSDVEIGLILNTLRPDPG